MQSRPAHRVFTAGANRAANKTEDILAKKPRGSKYLAIKELGLKDHICCGVWDLIPDSLTLNNLDPLGNISSAAAAVAPPPPILKARTSCHHGKPILQRQQRSERNQQKKNIEQQVRLLKESSKASPTADGTNPHDPIHILLGYTTSCRISIINRMGSAGLGHSAADAVV